MFTSVGRFRSNLDSAMRIHTGDSQREIRERHVILHDTWKRWKPVCMCVCVSFVCICRWKSRLAPVLWCWSLTLPEWVTHEFFSPFVDRISVLLCWFRPKLQSTLKVEQEWLAYEIGSEPQSWTTTHQLQSVATSCSPMASNYCQCRWMLRGHHIMGSFHEHQWERERGNVSKVQGLLRCKDMQGSRTTHSQKQPFTRNGAQFARHDCHIL